MIELAARGHGDSPLPLLNRDRGQQLYHCARDRSRRAAFWSKLSGKPRRLLDLKSVETNCRVHPCGEAALRVVPIAQIQGSAGRAGDFDCDFNPRKDHSRGRWLGIYRAREQGQALPPVSLVQVGDVYFVKDGHHRISVASTLGQGDIEARVTAWQVEGLLPWATSEPVRLWDRVLSSLRGLLASLSPDRDQIRSAARTW